MLTIVAEETARSALSLTSKELGGRPTEEFAQLLIVAAALDGVIADLDDTEADLLLVVSFVLVVAVEALEEKRRPPCRICRSVFLLQLISIVIFVAVLVAVEERCKDEMLPDCFCTPKPRRR